MPQPFIQAETALESMRDSDFDCYSAYSEAIDNSIQALAENVWIDFLKRTSTHQTASVVSGVVFTDDGHGMDQELLHKCLTLGHSSRFNDRKGIGRFGVGMTLGAIHECRRIEVYSKQDGGDWMFTYMDLDEINDHGAARLNGIPVPIARTPEESYTSRLRNSPSGTVVKWLKYDRASEQYDKVVEESEFYFGRTFRKFIWGTSSEYNQIKIWVNGRVIPAFDPLFVTTDLTAFPEDPKAELFEPTELEWTSYKKEKAGERKMIKGKVSIEMSLLPLEFRKKMGDGGSYEAKLRKIDRNEGISILRNDREVFFGHIPYIKSDMGYGGEQERMKTRFIGIEISFDAELDEAFTVKNIKRGAVPVQELRDVLANLIRPTVKTQLEQISKDWKRQERETEALDTGGDESAGILGGNRVTNSVVKPIARAIRMNVGANPKDENQVATIIAEKGAQPIEIELMRQRLQENKLTVVSTEWPGNTFMEMQHANAFKTLIYNNNSGFRKNYSKFFTVLAQKDDKLARDFEVLVDLIFISYMLGESDIPEGSYNAVFFQNMMKQNWANRMEELMQYVLPNDKA